MKKNYFFLVVTFCVMSLLTIETKAQNLEFNSAVFYGYSATGDGSSSSDALSAGTLIVSTNQIFKITAVNATIKVNNLFVSAQIFINGRPLSGFSGSEIFLPSGTYQISLSDYPNSYASSSGVISGVLYDVVP
jgi:hypothetical protein